MNRSGLFAAVAAMFVSLAWGCGGDDVGGEKEVEKFVPTSLEVRADGELKVGSIVQLRAIGTRDGESRELVEGITFASSDEAIATVDKSGRARIIAGGAVSFTASLGELSAEMSSRATCEYPRFSPEFVLGRVMPKLSWPAYDRDGKAFEFDLEKVYCDADWKDVTTITFVLSAGWCGPCTDLAQGLSMGSKKKTGNARFDYDYLDLEDRGMRIATVEVQDVQGNPGTSAFARDHLSSITGGKSPSIALGDADTKPKSGFVQDSSLLEYFPTVFVVRTRDMRIIADAKRWSNYLPLAAIAEDPEADWSLVGKNNFRSKCGSSDEESIENWVHEGALPIDPGTHKGGICQDAPDFYSIDLPGAWTLDLDFKHDVGDLDLVVWDVDFNQPLLVGGQVVGSTGKGDRETIEFSGPAIVAVSPFQHASAPYVLTLTEH